jgi:hypothetical protein
MNSHLGTPLDQILNAELSAGNEVEGAYFDQFAQCKHLVVLKRPFREAYGSLPETIEVFENRDSHYPVGKGYRDIERLEILLAPFA